MNRFKNHLIKFLSLGAFVTLIFVTGCRDDLEGQSQVATLPTPQRSTPQSSTDGSRKIASVGDRLITEADIQRRLEDLSMVNRARYQSPARRQELLDSLIRFELLATEAERRGYDQDPEVQMAYQQALVRKLLINEVRSLVKMSDIGDAEIESYYQKHRSDYERPELARAAHILYKTEAEASAALKELKLHILARPQDERRIFADRAAQESVDQETRARRGDLQYFTREGEGHGERRFPQSAVPSVVAQAVFALERVGELVSDPIQSDQGWHIAQRTGGKRAFKRPLSEVRGEIRKTLFRLKKSQALEDYIEGLKAQVKIEINQELLNAIEISRDASKNKQRRLPRSPQHQSPLPLPLTRDVALPGTPQLPFSRPPLSPSGVTP